MNITLNKICFQYSDKKILENLSLSVESGSVLLIRGNSGVGKSTLLRIISGLIDNFTGDVQIGEHSLHKMSSDEKSELRLKNFSYVHQDNHLVEHWSVEENLKIISENKDVLAPYLKKFDLDIAFDKLVQNLSGGEKQRLSIALALAKNPKILLLDEPTAHLDNFHFEQIMGELLNSKNSRTTIVVSHDQRLEKLIPQTLNLKAARL